MDQLSKIISLAIGLIIVVVAFAVFTGKINTNNGLLKFLSSNTQKVTPTPTNQPKFKQLFDNSSPELKQSAPASKYSEKGDISISVSNTTDPATSIPATGNPTMVIPLAISMFALGSYLRKSK